MASDGGRQVAVGVLLFAAVGLYGRGLHRAWRRRGPGRGVRRSEAFAFGTGLVVLAVILGLPLHDWGRLHVAPHMLEHGLLTMVAAPLLAATRPGVPVPPRVAVALAGPPRPFARDRAPAAGLAQAHPSRRGMGGARRTLALARAAAVRGRPRKRGGSLPAAPSRCWLPRSCSGPRCCRVAPIPGHGSWRCSRCSRPRSTPPCLVRS
jgi:hypothetical protein